jgi:restriction system protein
MQEPSRAVELSHKVRPGKTTRSRLIKGTAIFLLFVFATSALQGNWVSALVWMGGGLGIWIVWKSYSRQRERSERLHELDTMADAEFSRHAADLLQAQGYEVTPLVRSSPPGTDFLLTRGAERRLGRVARHARPLTENVIIKTLTASRAQGCEGALVLANQPFSLRARTLAQREDCILIDRETLATLVTQYRQGHRVLAFQRSHQGRGQRRKRP